MLISLLALAFTASAHLKSDDLLAIGSPKGIRVLTLTDVDGVRDDADLVQRTLPRIEGMNVGRPISEDDLFSRFRQEADVAIARFVKFAIGSLRLRGLSLDLAGGTAVRYDVVEERVPGRTTAGVVDACWECFGAVGNREAAARQLGIELEPLGSRASLNPRYTRQLVRNSAALYRFTFRTVERGTVRAGLALELDESYHPFVADVPVVKELFGERLIGASQRVRIEASATLDPFVFGRDRVQWTEVDLFAVATRELTGKVPRTFAEVFDRAVPDQTRAGFVAQALRDMNENLRGYGMMTKDSLALPGAGWFWQR